MPLVLEPIEALHQVVHVPVDGILLQGDLRLPPGAPGLVMFVNGRRSSRHSARHQFIAEALGEARMGTLLFDLLTPEEEGRETVTGALKSDLALLARRLTGAVRWLERQPHTSGLKVGCLGTGIGAAAALMAATEQGDRIAAVVSAAGRPDLVGHALSKVPCPTRLIIPGHDEDLLTLNVEAYGRLHCTRDLHLVRGAAHLFQEQGRMRQVADLSAEWFGLHLGEPS